MLSTVSVCFALKYLQVLKSQDLYSEFLLQIAASVADTHQVSGLVHTASIREWGRLSWSFELEEVIRQGAIPYIHPDAKGLD